MTSNRISNYSITAIPGLSWQAASAVGTDQHALRSVLSKSILASGRSFNEIVSRQSLQQDTGMVSLINRIPIMWAVMAAVASIAALVLVLAAIIVLVRRNRAEQRLLAIERDNERKAIAVRTIEKANAAKYSFFSSISHHMRTPLKRYHRFYRPGVAVR